VLRCISNRGSTSLAELHKDSGISRPALLRLLATLEAEGYVRRWLTDGRYRISFNAPEIVKSRGLPAIMADLVGPVLQDLLPKLSWPADIAVRDGHHMIVCETTRRKSPHLVHPVNAGYRVHMLQSAVGRAFLAFCRPFERDNILAALRKSGDLNDQLARDEKAIDALLMENRKRGYAFRKKGYFANRPNVPLEFSAIAVPILYDSHAMACLSVTWIATAMSEQEFVASYLPAIQIAARRAEHVLSASDIDFDAIRA
jgi:IclR family mhp operon transcriptional activator